MICPKCKEGTMVRLASVGKNVCSQCGHMAGKSAPISEDPREPKAKSEVKVMPKKGTCLACNRPGTIQAKGLCYSCYPLLKKCDGDVDKVAEYRKEHPVRGTSATNSGYAKKSKGPKATKSASGNAGEDYLEQLLQEREELDTVIDIIRKRLGKE